MKITKRNRNRLRTSESSETTGANFDDAPAATLLFEHESSAALARLSSDRLAEMRAEAETLAEVDVEVHG